MTIPESGLLCPSLSSPTLARNRTRLPLSLCVLVLGFSMSGCHTSPGNAAGDAGQTLLFDGGVSCAESGTCIACTVDLGNKIRDVDPGAIGATISTYGDNIAVSSSQRAALGSLGVRRYRIPIRWNNGHPISSAAGGPTNISADQYIQAIQALGADVVLVVGGDTGDNDFTPEDAANLVARYQPMGVQRYLLGNEPGNSGISIDTYTQTLFNPAVDAMKAIHPDILVGGPTWAYFDLNTLKTFVAESGGRFDLVDFHHYGMGSTALDTATAMAQTRSWGDEVAQTYAMLADAGYPDKQVTVGEYNWSWQFADQAGGDQRFFSPIVTAWASSVIGHGLEAGGWLFEYSDQNGALGLTVQPGAEDDGRPADSPMPIFHGLGMWTGEDAFRGAGSTLYGAGCADADVEAYAASGPNVLLINKSPSSKSISLRISPLSARSVTLWQSQSNGFDPPTRVGAGLLGDAPFGVVLPGYSVSTLVFE